MGRPRKDAEPPDSKLVALRIPGALLARVDALASAKGLTRSAALRDLVARGLSALEGPRSPRCPWCGAPVGDEHHEECPHHPDSPIGKLSRGGRRSGRR
jgi:hypothetical protein